MFIEKEPSKHNQECKEALIKKEVTKIKNIKNKIRISKTKLINNKISDEDFLIIVKNLQHEITKASEQINMLKRVYDDTNKYKSMVTLEEKREYVIANVDRIIFDFQSKSIHEVIMKLLI